MGDNFYLDNPDLKFNMERWVDWKSIVELKLDLDSDESPFSSVEEAIETYTEMLADPVGELAAQRFAPRAEEVDREGCVLENGAVKLPEAMERNLRELSEAQLMGITLPEEYGGLNLPKTFYTAATEIVSRADASLMNFFGLQGIAETIALFASEELKERYLPGLCSGELTGAMVLTEPEAGSDLAAIQTRAIYDPGTDTWRIRGTKRFITNGCGDVLLVLARSEDPEKYGGARGLSLFLVEKSDAVKVRRIEDKMGLHGSPTCELYFDDAPGYLIGRRGRGLTRYTGWLMSAARLAIAAQSLGICEAALREGVKFAEEREQFGKKIKEFPQVAEMLVNMQVYTEAVRALTYAASQAVDLQEGAERKGLKSEARRYSKLAETLTPMAKYYSTEKCIAIASDSLQIHGGSGYMKDYPIERIYRDARITNIYEGTSQIQVNWTILRIIKGDLDERLDEMRSGNYGKLEELASIVRQGHDALRRAVEHIRASDPDYRDLVARKVVDIAVDVYISYLLLDQARLWDRKEAVAGKFISDALPRIRMNLDYILSDDRRTMEEFDIIVSCP
ncbi:TPA: acyl-CoA dehydrogenase [Candidatus Poribacteria bacterium]|nr:acyl-CoA dehydrogenase [Candidatus Poribacteria bacterium]